MQLVNTEVMAKALDTTPTKLRAMVDAGDVPYVPIGRLYKFHPESVLEALQQKREREQRYGRSSRSRTARRKVS